MSDNEFGFDDEGDFDPFASLDGLESDAPQSNDGDDRMQRIESFDKEVDANMRILLSRKRDSEARRSAALWLGEIRRPKSDHGPAQNLS